MHNGTNQILTEKSSARGALLTFSSAQAADQLSNQNLNISSYAGRKSEWQNQPGKRDTEGSMEICPYATFVSQAHKISVFKQEFFETELTLSLRTTPPQRRRKVFILDKNGLIPGANDDFRQMHATLAAVSNLFHLHRNSLRIVASKIPEETMLFDKPADRDLASRILSLEAELDLKAKELGVTFRSSPARIGPQLRSLSFEVLSRIENSLDHLARAFELCIVQDTDPWDDGEFFKLSMRELGLTFPSDFLSRLQRDDVVEAYNMNRMQIFRNMRFMEISTYSLLEVLSYEWTQLFERSSHITQSNYQANRARHVVS